MSDLEFHKQHLIGYLSEKFEVVICEFSKAIVRFRIKPLSVFGDYYINEEMLGRFQYVLGSRQYDINCIGCNGTLPILELTFHNCLFQSWFTKESLELK